LTKENHHFADIGKFYSEIRSEARAEAIKEVFNELKKAKKPCVAKNGFIIDAVLWDELVKIAKEMGVE
jgi:hypothetical protein